VPAPDPSPRLLVAKDGAVLAEPYRERELDLKALLAEG